MKYLKIETSEIENMCKTAKTGKLMETIKKMREEEDFLAVMIENMTCEMTYGKVTREEYENLSDRIDAAFFAKAIIEDKRGIIENELMQR